MHFDILNNDNYVIYCATHYDSKFCSSTKDFLEDLNRIRYIKKLITRYLKSGDLKERLILNHIIILNNVFGPEVTVRILYFKLHKYFKQVKPFLILLNILPDKIYNIGEQNIINTDEIEMDTIIIEALRKI